MRAVSSPAVVSRVSTRATLANRRVTIRAHSRMPARINALSVDDVTKSITDTISEVQSVSGAKTLALRATLYGAPLLVSANMLQAAHLGGAGMGAAMKVAGLGAPGGPLAAIAGLWLFNAAAPYLQTLMAVAGILNLNDKLNDIPNYFIGITYLLAGASLWHFGSAGFTNIWTRHWVVFHLSMAVHVLTNTSKVRELLDSAKLEGMRRCATVGPLMVMAALFFQGASMSVFEAAGMTGPGILGPIGGLLFHWLFKWIALIGGLAYLTNAETKYSSVILGLSYVVAGVSLCPQLVAPLGLMAASMNLYNGLSLLKETTPSDSFIPSIA